jgi:hypothetical protein
VAKLLHARYGRARLTAREDEANGLAAEGRPLGADRARGPLALGEAVAALEAELEDPKVAEKAKEANKRPPTTRFLFLEKAAFGAAFALCIMSVTGPILEVITHWWPSQDERVMLRDLPFLFIWGILTVAGFILIPVLSGFVHKHPTPIMLTD